MVKTIVNVMQKVFSPCNSRQPKASESQEELLLNKGLCSEGEQKELGNDTHPETKDFFVILKGRDAPKRRATREHHLLERSRTEKPTTPKSKSAHELPQPQQIFEEMEPMIVMPNTNPILPPTLPVQRAGIGGSKFIEVMDPDTDFPRFPYIGFITTSS